MHPEWIPADLTGSLYLSRIADLSARRTADDDTPRPPDITVAGATIDREWEYEQAPHESQTVAVRRRGGAIGGSLVFGAMGRRQQCSDSRRERCTSLGRRRVSRWATRMGPSRSPPHSSSLPRGIPLPYLHRRRRRHQCRFREVVVSLEGDVRNALGESYMSMARGGICVTLASDGQYRGRKRRCD